jgi:hypothetical protein
LNKALLDTEIYSEVLKGIGHGLEVVTGNISHYQRIQ